MPRVAICAVAQTKYVRDRWQDRFQGMCWEVVHEVVCQTGLDLAGDDIGAVVSNSDDFFDCRTISDNAITDVVGAHYKGKRKSPRTEPRLFITGTRPPLRAVPTSCWSSDTPRRARLAIAT